MFDFLLGNDLLSALLAFGIVLIPAVIVHELGHFLAARAVGITILEFGIGFPPRIAKLFTWRETEFTLNAIPLGGFVRPLGEDMIRPLGEEETERDRQQLVSNRQEKTSAPPLQTQTYSDEAEQPEPEYRSEREELEARGFEDIRAVYDVKPLPRIFFMAAGALANFVFAFFMFMLIGLIGLPEQVGAQIGFVDVGENTALTAIGLESEDFIHAVNGETYDSRQEMIAALRELEGETVSLSVRRTAPDVNEELTIEAGVTPELVALLESVQPYVLITSVQDESPGLEAGLEAGDYIIAFNGEVFDNATDPAEVLIGLTNAAAGEEVTLTILRDGETFDTTLTPRLNPPPGDGRIGIGIRGELVTPDSEVVYMEFGLFDAVPQSLGASFNYASERFFSVFGLIAEFPNRLLQGNTEPEERRIVSVVGVSQLGGAILQNSIEDERATPLLDYVALISIALGFTNLLPIPALDGGRIVFAVLELIRGKPVPPEQEGFVHLVGVIFILSLGVFVIINDLVNPLTNIIPQ